MPPAPYTTAYLMFPKASFSHLRVCEGKNFKDEEDGQAGVPKKNRDIVVEFYTKGGWLTNLAHRAGFYDQAMKNLLRCAQSFTKPQVKSGASKLVRLSLEVQPEHRRFGDMLKDFTNFLRASPFPFQTYCSNEHKPKVQTGQPTSTGEVSISHKSQPRLRDKYLFVSTDCQSLDR